ncbi:MAG: matrixin family metalloprotease [Pseudomonadota bacterium]
MTARAGATGLVFFAVLAWSTPVPAWVQSNSSKGAGLHWPDLCHVVYAYLDGSADVDDGSDIEAIRLSLETWNAEECSGFTMVWGGLTNMQWIGYTSYGGNANIVIFHEEDWPYDQRPVAFTSVTYNPVTGVIFDADIELNAEDYEFTAGGPDMDPGDIDIQNTITHEAGHIVGLDHSNKVKATMYEYSVFGETVKRTLDKDDVDGLCTLYPLTGGATTCEEVQKLDLWVDDPDVPPGPASNPSCTAASQSASGSGVLLLLAGIAMLTRRRRMV